MSTVKTYADAGQLAEAAAEHFVACAQAAVDARGRFSVALAGGSTPRAMYARLAQEDWVERVDWMVTHVFWGDERAVPQEDADSNYRMAKEVLLDHVPIPEQNVHRISGELAPAAAATQYEAALRRYFSSYTLADGPVTAKFDLVLLGMGEDGHTASLFPGSEIIREARHWVAAYYVEKLEAWRISLTPAAINAARQVTFIVQGREKAQRLQQVLYGPYQPDKLPAQIVRPAGRLLWMVDEAAAGLG